MKVAGKFTCVTIKTAKFINTNNRSKKNRTDADSKIVQLIRRKLRFV